MPFCTGVIQPLPGMGDMIWLLPALRAIAAQAPDGKITLFTKPSTMAKQLLAADKAIDAVVFLPTKRGLFSVFSNFFHVWWALIRSRPDRLYIMHQSIRYRLAARLAGIKEIIPYPPALARSKENAWKKSLLFLEYLSIPSMTPHSSLTLLPHIQRSAEHYFGAYPKPWFVIAPGCSQRVRCWPTDRFAVCADAAIERWGGTVFIMGAEREADQIEAVTRACQKKENVKALAGLSFDLILGLLSSSVGLLGNDSGPGNVAAALGLPALMLCGVTRPPPHSPHLIVIEPDGEARNSMERISTARVLDYMRQHIPTGIGRNTF